MSPPAISTLLQRHWRGLIATASLVLLTVWIARNTYWTEVSVPSPEKGEAASDPFYAAGRLVRLLGARTSMSRGFIGSPATDAVVVISEWNWDLMADRRERLERWVESGGRLVLDQTVFNIARLGDWCGIGRDDRGRLISRRPLIWLEKRTDEVRALRVRIGKGSVTVFDGDPYLHRALLDADNARLFVAGTQLRGGDSVYFLTEATGASLLELLWQYGASAVVLALGLIGLALWRGAVRFGPLLSPVDPARRSLAEQIRGTGNFAARFGGGRALHAAAVRALRETAVRRIPRFGSLPAPEQLERLARLSGLPAPQLAAAIEATGPHTRGGLREILALLENARRAIAATGAHVGTIGEGTIHAGSG